MEQNGCIKNPEYINIQGLFYCLNRFTYSVGLSLKYSLKHFVKYEGDEKPVS